MGGGIAEAIMKIVGYGLEIFVKNSARRDAIMKSFRAFFKESNKDSQVSADLREEYEAMKEVDPWLDQEENSKS